MRCQRHERGDSYRDGRPAISIIPLKKVTLEISYIPLTDRLNLATAAEKEWILSPKSATLTLKSDFVFLIWSKTKRASDIANRFDDRRDVMPYICSYPPQETVHPLKSYYWNLIAHIFSSLNRDRGKIPAVRKRLRLQLVHSSIPPLLHSYPNLRLSVHHRLYLWDII